MNGGVVLYSDPHFSNRTAFGRFETNAEFPGCNSRFHHIAKTLTNALDYANKNDCEAFFILGDVFHERGIIHVPVYKAVYDILNQPRTFPVYMIPGNHDVVDIRAMYGDKGLTSLFALKKDCSLSIDQKYRGLTNVFDNWGVVQLSFAWVAMLPFSTDEKKIIDWSDQLLPKKEKGKLNILMLHHSFIGALTGSHEWVMPNGIDPDDLNPAYDLVFSGHYHRHQIVGKKRKVIYVGAPLQHDFGERTYVPGFIHLFPDGTGRHIENDFSPRFDIIETSEINDLLLISTFRNDYVSIRWKGDSSALKDVKLSDNVIIDSTPMATTLEARTTIKTTDSVEEQLKKYVEVKAEGSKEHLDKGVSLYKGK
jgi:DNA repair exonuclease SbcCD nuclease subunit